jgi:hypothetical protein
MSRIEYAGLQTGRMALASAAAALLYAASPGGPAAAQDLTLTDIEKIPQGQQLKELFPGAGLIIITQAVNGETQRLAIIDRQYAEEDPFPASIGPKGGGTMTTRADGTISFEFSPGCDCFPYQGGCVWIPKDCNK